ncbi:MAG: hypothetical protein K6D02_07955 [Lachnospiraceae bacterium]|nr:hypothetical protein [Lachnospiraceae bacterium]
MIKNNIKVLLRSRFVLGSMIILSGFVIFEILALYGKKWPVTEPLGNAMTLSVYLFIAMMFIAYEYMRNFFNNGVAEIVNVLDKKGKNVISAFLIIGLYSSLLCLCITILVIYEFLYYKISDPNHEYILHIILAVFLNIYMVMILASIIGTTLACIKNRIAVYSIITMMTLFSSPFAENVAYSIDMASLSNGSMVGKIVFKIISFFYIMPRFNMRAMPRAEFGEPILPYRFCIILFWILFFVFIGFILRKKKKIYIVSSVTLCLIMFIGFNTPASRMDDKLDAYQNGIPDTLYVTSGMYQEKIKRPDYKINEYDMKLSIKSNLTADIAMKVSNSLQQYDMTLYRKYIVYDVENQNGEKLKYKQFGDYISIYNRKQLDITEIRIKTKGNSSDCYANYQGCYLPGYYLYYPRAGFVDVYNMTYGSIIPNFVSEKTLFKVEVFPKKDYISNLPKIGNKYVGKCDGFTLVRGFYKKKNLGNGNVLVYPYLDEFTIHDGKKSEEECWDDSFQLSSEQLKKDKIKNSIIFKDPGVLDGDAYGFKAYGKNQIFVNVGGAFYYSDDN